MINDNNGADILAIVDELIVSIILLSPMDEIMYLNRGTSLENKSCFYRCFDIEQDLSIGEKIVSPKWVDRVRKAQYDQKSYEYVETAKCPESGIDEHFHNIVQPMKYDDKDCTVIITKNVTERIKQEEDILSMFDNIEDAYFRCDLDGNVIFVSQSVKNFFQYNGDVKDLVGRNILEVIPNHNDMEKARELRERIGKLTDYEMEMKRYDGSSLMASINSSFFFDNKGNPKGFEGTLRDITDRKKMEDELLELKNSLEEKVNEQTESLKRSVQQVEQAYKAKSDFITNISHELLTPLHGILNFSEIGVKKCDRSDRIHFGKYFEAINESAIKLNESISTLLDFSKFSSGEFGCLFKKINFTDLVYVSCDPLRDKIDKKRIEIFYPDREKYCYINADPDVLVKAVENVIDNAIKFSDVDSPVFIDIAEEGNNYQLTIKDEGIGVPEDEIDKIFDSFSKISNRDQMVAEGAGMGLTIAKQIIETHSGEIRAEMPTNGIGLSVIINIPRYKE